MSAARRSVWFYILVLMGIVGVGFVGLTVLVSLFSGSFSTTSFLGDPVAVIKVEGPIFDVYDTLKELHELSEDKNIRAVVVRVDSPGGAVGPSQEVFRELLKLKKNSKTVVISMGTVAASGGYYVALAGDKIMASPGTITGSIGVIMQSFGVQELAKKLMIDPRVIKSGLFKDAGSPFRDMTEDEKKYLQTLSDDVYEQFLRDVSEQRKIDLDKVRQLAEGKIYSGRQAREAGLIDELGNLYDAIDLAKTLAALPSDAGIRWPREPSSFEKWLSPSVSLGWQNLFDKVNGLAMPVWMRGAL